MPNGLDGDRRNNALAGYVYLDIRDRFAGSDALHRSAKLVACAELHSAS